MISIQEPRHSKEIPDVVFGIDFGTTNSLVALANSSNDVEFIPDSAGRCLLRSVVLYSNSGVEVGGDISDPFQALYDIKYNMSKPDYNAEAIIVGSEIFKKLKLNVLEKKNIDLTHAVISVPARFDSFARSNVVKAARMAGIETIRLINEPTAAALAYGISEKISDSVYIVYDLGGGTFDVSVLKFVNGVFRVLATGGSLFLGGNNFTELLLDLVLSKSSIDKTVIPEIEKRRLLLEAERVRIALTNSNIVEFQAMDLFDSIQVSRSEFEDASRSLVNETISIMNSVIGNIVGESIESILLVGGAVRMPMIFAAIRREFQCKITVDSDPDKIVARGAAIQGYLLSGRAKESKLLIDVLPLSLGLETAGGLTEKIILRNEPLPAVYTQTFTTQVDNQTGIQVHVCQGESEMACRNRSLIKFEFTGIRPGIAGSAKIDVEFRVDVDGMLTVTIIDLLTQKSFQMEVMQNFGLDNQSIKEILESSIVNFGEDFKESSLERRRLSCIKLLSAAELLCMNRYVSSESITEIKEKMNSVLDALSKPDINVVITTGKDLEHVLNTVLSKISEVNHSNELSFIEK